MSGWTKFGDSEVANAELQPAVGDVWVDKTKLVAEWPIGRVDVADVLPIFVPPKPDEASRAPEPVTKVCIEKAGGAREWLTVAELRRRFVFRSRA